MRNKPLGCLSIIGIVPVMITLVIIGGWTLLFGGVLFSPGGLNAQAGQQALGGILSHAEAGGRCDLCHARIFSSTVMADRCLVCHQNLIQNSKDFHRLMLAEAKVASCHGCHTEHHGPQGSLTVFDSTKFPHESIGFSLRSHQQNYDGSTFACSNCHGTSILKLDISVCASCHRKYDSGFMDSHIMAYGAECLACHDGLETVGLNFNHNRSIYPLVGKHTMVECVKCHTGAHSLSDLKATPTDCFSCHSKDDAHLGQFGNTCADCHTPEDWKKASFDHSKSVFKLIGAHASVPCEKCHLNNVFKGTPTDCYTCHSKDDTHQGNFGKDCGGCHSPDSWKNAVFDHSKSVFPLSGAHQNVACEKCHTNNIFKGTPQQCSACHPDPAYHAGLFGLDCQGCHTTAAWSPGQFNSPHPFPINHGGSGNACTACHPSSLVAYTCYTCHDRNQTIARHREEVGGNIDDCLRCHATGGGGRD
jgi:hypothetical protein